jgi:hypothetical protein
MKKLLLLFGAVLLAQPLLAQPPEAFPGCSENTNLSFAPLFLYTNGPGKIYAFTVGDHDRLRLVEAGEELPVGGRFALLAVPERGYELTNWNAVNVFTLTTAITETLGSADTTYFNTSTIISDLPPTSKDPVLIEEVPAVDVILATITTNVGGAFVTNSELTQAKGWQANFVALPPPRRHRD